MLNHYGCMWLYVWLYAWLYPWLYLLVISVVSLIALVTEMGADSITLGSTVTNPMWYIGLFLEERLCGRYTGSIRSNSIVLRLLWGMMHQRNIPQYCICVKRQHCCVPQCSFLYQYGCGLSPSLFLFFWFFDFYLVMLSIE